MTCATPSDGARRLRQRCSIVAVLVALLLTSATAEQARSEETPGDCLGIGFEVAHPVTIAKIIADQSQVRFVKSAYDDPACPADRDTCAQTSYLVPGDLALVGKTHGAYSCVSYQSAADRIGNWTHAGGTISISRGRRGALRIRGEQVYPAAQNVHTGVISAEAKPAHGILQFADDGSSPFSRGSDEAGNCLVRMQRIAALLVVEDNGHCGGSMVTFTGFYRRNKS